MACGACNFGKKKCVPGCIFAPYFSSGNMGAAQFRAIHKVFGTSNFSKLLQKVPEDKRSDAVASFLAEAEFRINNPIQGCLAKLVALRKEVETLKIEAAYCEAELAAGGGLKESSLSAAQYVNNQSHTPPLTTNNSSLFQEYNTPPPPVSTNNPFLQHYSPPVPTHEWDIMEDSLNAAQYINNNQSHTPPLSSFFPEYNAAQYVNNNQFHTQPLTTTNFSFFQEYNTPPPPVTTNNSFLPHDTPPVPTQEWDIGSLTASTAQQQYFPPSGSSVPVCMQWDTSSLGRGPKHQQYSTLPSGSFPVGDEFPG